MVDIIEWPWQYNFPPFFTIQTNEDTLKQQLTVWKTLVLDYFRASKQCILDVREASKTSLFRNTAISRRLPEDGIIVVMNELARLGHAEAMDKTQLRWYVFWEPLDQIGDNVLKWALDRGMRNAVCTLFEISEGDDSVGQTFHGIDQAVLEKALRKLESQRKVEIFEMDESKGVKFF